MDHSSARAQPLSLRSLPLLLHRRMLHPPSLRCRWGLLATPPRLRQQLQPWRTSGTCMCRVRVRRKKRQRPRGVKRKLRVELPGWPRKRMSSNNLVNCRRSRLPSSALLLRVARAALAARLHLLRRSQTIVGRRGWPDNHLRTATVTQQALLLLHPAVICSWRQRRLLLRNPSRLHPVSPLLAFPHSRHRSHSR